MLDAAGFDVVACSTPDDAGAAAGYVAAWVDDGVRGDGVAAVSGALRRVGVPVFGMTGVFVGPLNRELAMARFGVADYWSKPVDRAQALSWLQRICGDGYPEPPAAQATAAALDPDAAAARLDRSFAERPSLLRSAVYSSSEAESAAPTGPVPRQVPTEGSAFAPTLDAGVSGGSSGVGLEGTGTALDIPRPLTGDDPAWSPGRNELPTPPSDAGVLEAETRVGTAGDGVLDAGPTRTGGILDEGSTRVGGVLDGDGDTRGRSASMSPVIPVRSVPGEKLPRDFLLTGTQRAIHLSPPPQPAVLASDAWDAAGEPLVPPALNVVDVPWVGDLGERALATVLAALAYNQSTGALVLEQGDDRRLLYLEHGLPLAVAASRGAPTLFDMLAQDGLLAPDAVYELHHVATHGRRCAGQVLVESGLFSDDDVTHLEGVFVRRRMLDVFSWSSGAYTFREGDVPTVVHGEPPIGPMELIWDGVQHGLPLALLRAPIDPHIARVPVWLNEPPTPEDMEMSGRQQALIRAIDGERTLHAAMREAGGDEAVERFAYVLLATGFLGFER